MLSGLHILFILSTSSSYLSQKENNFMLLAIVQIIVYLTFLYGLQQSCLNEVDFFTNKESTGPAVRFCMSYSFLCYSLHKLFPPRASFS